NARRLESSRLMAIPPWKQDRSQWILEQDTFPYRRSARRKSPSLLRMPRRLKTREGEMVATSATTLENFLLSTGTEELIHRHRRRQNQRRNPGTPFVNDHASVSRHRPQPPLARAATPRRRRVRCGTAGQQGECSCPPWLNAPFPRRSCSPPCHSKRTASRLLAPRPW